MSQGLVFDDKLFGEIPDDILFDLHLTLEQSGPKEADSGSFWESLPPLRTSGYVSGWNPLNASQEIKLTSSLNLNIDPDANDLMDNEGVDPSEVNKTVASKNINSNKSEPSSPPPSPPPPSGPGPVTRGRKRRNNKDEVKIKEEKMEEPTVIADFHFEDPNGKRPDSQINTVLADFTKLLSTQETLLHEIEKKIEKLDPKQLNAFSELQQQLFQLQQQLKTESKEMNDMFRRWLLETDHLVHITSLLQSISVQTQRSDVYVTELQHLASESDKTVASLVIIDQPLSQVVFKGRPLDGSFEIKLIPGARCEALKHSEVYTKVNSEDEAWRTTKNAIQNSTAKLDKQYFATIKDIKLNISSRMTPIFFNFGCSIKSTSDEFTVMTENSSAVIVITNESQWGEAATKLFHLEAFRNTHEIPWTLYANMLHRFVFRASALELKANSKSVDADRVGRGLTDWELSYVHTKFFSGKSKIGVEESKKQFWSWFGHVLTTIRFKRHVRVLWLNGCVYGLIAKKDCNKLLKNELPGAFIIRFSDSLAGSFAVAYATDDPDEKVKHYLIKPEEISANKALPEFLKDKQLFKHLVYPDLSSDGKIIKAPKESVFGEFYKKSDKTSTKELDKLGYVQNL